MKNFKIYYDKIYWIKYNNNPIDYFHNEVSVDMLKHYYKLNMMEIFTMMKNYHGLSNYEKNQQYYARFPIHFEKKENAQDFIDNILIPYEIAYNLSTVPRRPPLFEEKRSL